MTQNEKSCSGLQNAAELSLESDLVCPLGNHPRDVKAWDNWHRQNKAIPKRYLPPTHLLHCRLVGFILLLLRLGIPLPFALVYNKANKTIKGLGKDKRSMYRWAAKLRHTGEFYFYYGKKKRLNGGNRILFVRLKGRRVSRRPQHDASSISPLYYWGVA